MRLDEVIKDFIVRELMHEDNRQPPADEASLLELGVLDSLGLLQVLAFLEKEYGLMIEDQDIIPENFESIGAITAFVERRRNGAPAR